MPTNRVVGPADDLLGRGAAGGIGGVERGGDPGLLGSQGVEHLVLVLADEVGDLAGGGRPAEVVGQQLCGPAPGWPARAPGGDPDGPARAAEVAAQRPDDRRLGEGQEGLGPVGIETPEGLHERLVGHLGEVVDGLAPAVLAAGWASACGR